MRLVPVLATLILASAPASMALAQEKPALLPTDGTILSVTAVGKVSRVPDIATVRAGVVTQDITAAGALAQNATRMARVIAALRASGIAERDLSTSSVSLQPQYRQADNQPPVVTGYQASNTVSVRFRDIAASGKALDVLVREGANQIDGPTLSIDKPEVALDQARQDAVAKGRARAELYARAAGLRVERIVSISENGEDAGGGPQPVMYRAAVMRDSMAASTTVLAGETEVTATVAIRFLLK